MRKLSTAAMFLMLLVVSIAEDQDFDIGIFGGKPNSDITKALTDAFKGACASTKPSKVLIQKGTYSLGPVEFVGPCKAPVEFEVRGTLIAQTEGTNKSSWVYFDRIDNLTVSGGGLFDGQGPKAWGTCAKGTFCKQLPVNLNFNSIKGGKVHDITCKDSKQFQVHVLFCKDFTFQNLTVSAPADSPNTDGIHISKSTLVNVLDSHIQTGDDCVSLGDGNQQITVERVTCGPGHGFSVGSLGKYKGEEPVVGFKVKNCTLTKTTNGVRIKTFPDSYEGIASDLHFEDIIVNDVANPIIIDQVYCPNGQCNPKMPSKVKISKVSFRNIRGTSSTPVAVKLSCSSAVPCQDVEMSDIDLRYSGNGSANAVSQCSNVRPKISGVMIPPACSAPVPPN